MMLQGLNDTGRCNAAQVDQVRSDQVADAVSCSQSQVQSASKSKCLKQGVKVKVQVRVESTSR